MVVRERKSDRGRLEKNRMGIGEELNRKRGYMKVYKFGGASVKDAEGVRNLQQIVAQESDDLVIVVSAMGKTTNALEALLADLLANKDEEATEKWKDILKFHFGIMDGLDFSNALGREVSRKLGGGWQPQQLRDAGVKRVLGNLIGDGSVNSKVANVYERAYDAVVSMGERMSTTIVAAYLRQCGIDVVLWDMTWLLQTDETFREAAVDMEASEKLIRKAWDKIEGRKIVVAQGFIGGTKNGEPTTLGREGSDYSAAIIGNILGAESVTIWKDVPGILNADPRLVSETTKIDELSYNDAVELAYSGAQVIHPKTIRPLENKHIPLYVKPFGDVKAAGSIIKDEAKPIDTPIYIWRKNQILVTMRAKDFSFVLEESLSHIFEIVKRNRLKVSLIQSSAVTISVCMDNDGRRVQQAIAELQNDYKVSWNEGLNLLSIRGTTPEILRREQEGRTILLSQTTRRTARFVMKETNLI